MKKSFTPLLLLVAGLSLAQQKKNIAPLIDAEKNFAAYSVSNGTKDAFLHFLDSNGVVFQQGQSVNGIELWSKREKSPGILNWRPAWAGISASGDFGYTSGPWTFQPATIDDSVVASGNYTTIWHRNSNGEWKFLVDLGVNNSPDETGIPSWQDADFSSDQKTYKGTLESLLKAEIIFIGQTANNKDRLKWYRQSLSRGSVLHRNGRLPAIGSDSILAVMNSMPGKIEYTMSGSGIAGSGDLGYMYGTTKINGKTDNYLRIWKKESGGWKIVVEVLRY